MISALVWDVMRCMVILTDVSGQLIGSMFKGQETQGEGFSMDLLTLDDGTDKLSETSVRNYHTPHNIPGERRIQDLRSSRPLEEKYIL